MTDKTALDPIAHEIWDMKYRFKSADGTPIDETVDDTWRRVAKALAPHHPGPVTVVKDGTDIEDGRRTIRAGQRDAGLVLALSGTDNPDWRAMAVAECDEVVRVADATASPVPHPDEARLDRGRNAILPRQTLLLVHPDDTRHPTGTAAWLEPRRIDRHLHARLGNACDTGRVARILTGRAVGLVLSGGGARGAAHLGAFRAMQEAGSEPDLVGGTSIGGGDGSLVRDGPAGRGYRRRGPQGVRRERPADE
jgi:hypothetical protein